MRIRHAADHDLVPASAGSEVRWLAEACDRLCELMEDSWCRVLVAEERGQIIAVLGLVLNRPDSRRSGIATICVLQVHPNHNRRGIGSRLVRFAEGIARINGCRAVEVLPELVGWGEGRCWPGLGYWDPGAGLQKVLGTRLQESSA